MSSGEGGSFQWLLEHKVGGRWLFTFPLFPITGQGGRPTLAVVTETDVCLGRISLVSRV